MFYLLDKSLIYQNEFEAIPNFIDDVLPYTYTKIDTYQITSYGKNKEMAIEYLKYLLTEDAAKLRYEVTGAIAPVDYENIISQDEYYSVVKKQLHRSIPLPNQIEFSYIYTPFQKAAQQMLRVPYQIKTIMDETTECINQELEKVIH